MVDRSWYIYTKFLWFTVPTFHHWGTTWCVTVAALPGGQLFDELLGPSRHGSGPPRLATRPTGGRWLSTDGLFSRSMWICRRAYIYIYLFNTHTYMCIYILVENIKVSCILPRCLVCFARFFSCCAIAFWSRSPSLTLPNQLVCSISPVWVLWYWFDHFTVCEPFFSSDYIMSLLIFCEYQFFAIELPAGKLT